MDNRFLRYHRRVYIFVSANSCSYPIRWLQAIEGRAEIIVTSSGGNATFGAQTSDLTGVKSSQLSMTEGVGGTMENQNDYQFITETKEVLISRGELGISAQALTDSGAKLYYTSLPYYTGKDYLTSFDSAKNEVVYINTPTRSFSQNGPPKKTITEQQQFNAIACSGRRNTYGKYKFDLVQLHYAVDLVNMWGAERFLSVSLRKISGNWV